MITFHHGQRWQEKLFLSFYSGKKETLKCLQYKKLGSTRNKRCSVPSVNNYRVTAFSLSPPCPPQNPFCLLVYLFNHIVFYVFNETNTLQLIPSQLIRYLHKHMHSRQIITQDGLSMSCKFLQNNKKQSVGDYISNIHVQVLPIVRNIKLVPWFQLVPEANTHTLGLISD